MARKNQLQKLKQQVRLLQRKEERSRNQLKAALKKARQLGKAYKSKLQMMKVKLAVSHASTYAKVAADVQRQMLKSVETRGHALKLSIQKLEKKYISKLAKTLVKKAKKSGTTRKTTAVKETARLIKKRRVSRSKKK